MMSQRWQIPTLKIGGSLKDVHIFRFQGIGLSNNSRRPIYINSAFNVRPNQHLSPLHCTVMYNM